MRKTLIAMHVLTAISSMVALPALSEENNKSGYVLEEVIVTAQKRDENSQDVPISIHAFGAETMEKLGATQLFDLSKSAPSLSTGGIPGSNSTSGLRGVVDQSRNIGIDARMGVYIDGVYQGRSSTANQPLVGLASVEILRGPQGTLFGKNTVSGAINLNTKKATEEFEGEVKVGVASEGELTTAGRLSGALSDTVFGALSYTKQSRDGFYNNTALNTTRGDWEQEGARGQLRFVPSEKVEIIISADSGSSYSEMPVYTKIDIPKYTTLKGDESDEVNFWGASVTANISTDSDYTFTSITAYRENDYLLIGDEDFNASVKAFATTFDEKTDQLSQEFRVVSPQNETYDWVAGLYYFDSTISTERNLYLGAPVLPAAQFNGFVAIPSSVDASSVAAYVHGNYRLTDKIEITAGIRFTDETKDFDFTQVNSPDDAAGAAFVLENVLGYPAATAAALSSQSPGALLGAFNLTYQDEYTDDNWSPTLGINYKASDDVMYYAKYSRGYQSGGFNGDFNPYLPAIKFNSEYVDAYEIGIKSTSSDGKLRFNADIFTQKFSDYQLFQRVPVGNTSVQIVSNAGEATSQGLEVETVWLPTEQLKLTLNATFLDAVYDKFDNPVYTIDPTQPENYNGNKLNHASDTKLYAGIQYLMPINAGEVSFNLDYSYQSDSYSNPTNDDTFELIPGYGLLNGRVTFDSSSERWQAAVWINNMTDKDYYINHSKSSLLNVDRVIWGMPRMYGLDIKYFFGK
ncbi:MAG TPA: TonB-dependent receptor [Pseudomonadales bacterium]|nr:TonB-dependent receptor [Pseudomonadales bacterium]